MGDLENEKMGCEARDAVGAERPAVGENRVQSAMRRYLEAAAFRSRGNNQDTGEKPDIEVRSKS